MHTEAFPKSEKLVSLKLIDRLFSGGGSKALSSFPLRLVYMQLAKGDEVLHVNGRTAKMADAQIMISVPKRCFKHAVDRNRVKRQVREAYRRHRDLYTLAEGKYLAMAFIWMDGKHHPSEEVERKVMNLLQRMEEKLHADERKHHASESKQQVVDEGKLHDEVGNPALVEGNDGSKEEKHAND